MHCRAFRRLYLAPGLGFGLRIRGCCLLGVAYAAVHAFIVRRQRDTVRR
jgi:hypothetical protein